MYYYERSIRAPRATWKAFMPGTFLIALGILIVAVPQLLAAMVATALVMSGTAALVGAYWLRKAQRSAPELHVRVRPSLEEDPFRLDPFGFHSH